MSKAQKRTAWKNLDFNDGNTLSSSFVSFSDSVLSSNVQNLGVSLGSSVDIVSDSVALLKMVEWDRLTACDSSKEIEDDSEIDILDCDEDNKLDQLTLSHLCGDLMEEVMDVDNGHLSCDFKTVYKKIKSKSSNRKKNNNPKVRAVNKHKIWCNESNLLE